jgi:hypothetical protein
VFESLTGSPDFASLLDRVARMRARATTVRVDVEFPKFPVSPERRATAREARTEIGGMS